MEKTTVIQGRTTTPQDIELVRTLVADHPEWNRTRLSKELCRVWNWRNATGRLKDMACRSFLLKLEKYGHLTLPPPHNRSGSFRTLIPEVAHQTDPIVGECPQLAPVTVRPVESRELSLFYSLLARYHYLGFRGTVGQNMKYLAYDSQGRPLSCLLFGSAAWKCAARDEYIGWSQRAREANLNLITNNARFLILPWVKVPHLASHILGRVSRRICADWREKYGHPLYLLETFVEQGRFRGTSYRAAGWTVVGQTSGRSRNDRYATLQVPVKDVYLSPLTRHFREVLCREV